MQLFIRLISTDIHNNEVALTANEFNSLRILFKIKPSGLQQTQNPHGLVSLSSVTPFYAPGVHNTKVQMNKLVGWLVESLSQQEEEGGYGSPHDMGS